MYNIDKLKKEINDESIYDKCRNSLKDFYHLFKDEVKTIKGYILTAIDGSDCEIPNTQKQEKNIKVYVEKMIEKQLESNYQIVMIY